MHEYIPDTHLRFTSLINNSSQSTITFSKLGQWGQFGNQLFQISAVLGYAVRYKAKVVLPPWRCQVSGRDYGEIFPAIKDLYGDIDISTLYNEISFSFQQIAYQKNLDIRGNFQSEKYFANALEEIRHIFIEPPLVTEKIENYLSSSNIAKFNAIHVRAYSHPIFDANFPISRLPEYYFVEAIKKISGSNPIFIVSDDREYAINLIRRFNIEDIIVFPDFHDSLVDFFFLSRAENLAISNSSFSWWSAYLGKKKERVFAPHRYFWFRPEYRKDPFWDTRDLYPVQFKELII